MGTNISRDSDVVELNDPPVYNYGEKVRAKKTVRNDGTYAGKDIGDILVKKGDEGFVVSIGTFLQQFYIYGSISGYGKPNRHEAQGTRSGWYIEESLR